MRRFSFMLVLAVLAATGRAAPPVVFDGFGLGNFEGAGSIAADLARIEADRSRASLPRLPKLTVAMQGPVGRDAPPVPMAAELRSRIDRFDVSAGMLADASVVAEGPARWMGRVGVTNDRDEGRESLELRTIVGNNAEWGLVGVELGPRIERRLGRGVTVFIDGKAEAQARRSADTGWWSMPGTATDGSSMVGVAACTGLTR